MGNFVKVSDVLKEMVDGKQASICAKKAVAFGFWKNITGAKFANFSIPYDIKGTTLFVAVKNPQVMQELIFNKEILIKKIKNYFLPLNINIETIKYDYKKWNSISIRSTINGDETSRYYDEEELTDVELTFDEKKDISNITNTINKLTFLSSNQKEKYFKNIINSIKAKKLRKDENFDR